MYYNTGEGEVGPISDTITAHNSILLQAVELDIIHGQAVEASENVKEGNEQVRGVSHVMLYIDYLSISTQIYMMDDKYVYMYVFIVLYTEIYIFANFITFQNTVQRRL